MRQTGPASPRAARPRDGATPLRSAASRRLFQARLPRKAASCGRVPGSALSVRCSASRWCVSPSGGLLLTVDAASASRGTAVLCPRRRGPARRLWKASPRPTSGAPDGHRPATPRHATPRGVRAVVTQMDERGGILRDPTSLAGPPSHHACPVPEAPPPPPPPHCNRRHSPILNNFPAQQPRTGVSWFPAGFWSFWSRWCRWRRSSASPLHR